MDLTAELTRILPGERVLTRMIDRIAHASDASCYRLVPAGVVRPESIEEIRALFRFSHSHRIPLTFRAAGTSLSGQAVTDGILVDVARHWRSLEIEDGGARVRVQPGVLGGVVNQSLRPFAAKIGPDPASINACMMGGILANNSSGMCCGVENNAYHTLVSMVFVLPGGVVVESAEPGAEDRLAGEAPEIAQGLLAIRDRVRGNGALVDRIRAKYRMKNTMGYSLNAFLDYDRPVEILSHLMIGSEGTLGFLAEAVLSTIDDPPLKYTGMMFFPDVPAACASIAPLRESGARTLELMDRASLRAIADRPGVPVEVQGLSRQAAAILVEYQAATEADLGAFRSACDGLVPRLPSVSEPIFTRDPDRQAALWAVRKGLIASVGARRPRGTSMIIEDVVFPAETLADGVGELQTLCEARGYDDAIVFGHAKDGNLHFVLNQGFSSTAEIERYDGFMHALSDLVAVRYGGALKAEHGTGRNMAPFLVAEWGHDAVEIMRAVKRLVDPRGLLNPGVILNDDPAAHVTHLKTLQTVEPEIDPCIECGFCERLCPSRDLTLTPRQRIVVRREIVRLGERDSDDADLRALLRDFVHDGIDTCATDGLCATACPVGIDTGVLVKRLRAEEHSRPAEWLAVALAGRFSVAESMVRAGIATGRALRTVLGRRAPLGGTPLPALAPRRLPRRSRHDACAVYFPSCVSRVLGSVPEEAPGRSLCEVVAGVAARAGQPLYIPEGVSDHCCGMPFSSKGYPRAYARAAERLVLALWDWTDAGRLPVVLDTSPCAWTLKHCGVDLPAAARDLHGRMRFLDGIEFAVDHVAPGLEVTHARGTVLLHPVCSAVKAGLTPAFERVASRCCDEVVIPASAGCCGFAGDRGYVVPELTASATRPMAREIAGRRFDGYYSSSRTCEIGLSRATGRPFRSFWYLLDEASR